MSIGTEFACRTWHPEAVFRIVQAGLKVQLQIEVFSTC